MNIYVCTYIKYKICLMGSIFFLKINGLCKLCPEFVDAAGLEQPLAIFAWDRVFAGVAVVAGRAVFVIVAPMLKLFLVMLQCHQRKI